MNDDDVRGSLNTMNYSDHVERMRTIAAKLRSHADDLGVIEYRGVPRPVEMRPGWLTDDERWREQLAALPNDDAAWITGHWELAGGSAPGYDMSRITYETDGPVWSWVAVAAVLSVLVVLIPVLVFA